MLYGADDGIYMSPYAAESAVTRVLALPDPITQIEVLELFNQVIFLTGHFHPHTPSCCTQLTPRDTGHRIMSVPLDALTSAIPTNSPPSTTRLASHTTFFRVGFALGRHLICVVKAGFSTTCKLLEPVFAGLGPTRVYKVRPYSPSPYSDSDAHTCKRNSTSASVSPRSTSSIPK